MSQNLTAGEFVQRWAGRDLTERAAAQSHFNDLCHLLGVPTPTDNPETDSEYGFEARTDVSASGVYATTSEDGLFRYQVNTGPGPGFVDVWKREHFCWEYKRPGKHKDLAAALAQAKIYKEYLGNPPLLIVSDIDRYEIHTNFTNYPPEVYRFTISDLVDPSDEWKKVHPDIAPMALLRKIWDDYEWFRPAKTTSAITEELASEIGKLAVSLRDAGNDPHAVAHLLMQIVFCLFAEDIGLLPTDIFTRIIETSIDKPKSFSVKARSLFKEMETGGHFGVDAIEWFNGGLFKDIESEPIINIAAPWLGKLLMVARADWNSVEPSILGTLFERSLDPDKRAQIGAHYTSRDDIMLIIEPVVMQPLRKRWVQVQKDVAEWLEQRQQDGVSERRKKNFNKKISDAIHEFANFLGTIRILDPACGSGNFLYVAIQQLLDLEHQVRAFAARPELHVPVIPRVHPGQLHGIEINDYAAELARVSIWIGYLQWLYRNEDSPQKRPILDPLNTIECRDALLQWQDDEGNSLAQYRDAANSVDRASWPAVDFIIGNPPFLGGSLIWEAFGTEYRDALWEEFALPNFSDFCCYWFELGKEHLIKNSQCRIGLLATQAIRGKTNRTVLEHIKESGDIFMAWSDREWILDGAAVHVSIIGFDSGIERSRTLDGVPVTTINADLTSDINLGSAAPLQSHLDVCLIGVKKAGPFDIGWKEAAHMLALGSGNPHGKSNQEVLRPVVNGRAITQNDPGKWIIDYGQEMSQEEASKYEAPFQYVQKYVYPERVKNKRKLYRDNWWLYAETRPTMRDAQCRHRRCLATPYVAKHRLFVWLNSEIIPADGLFIFDRSDDYFFGMVQNTFHTLWSLRQGTQLETRPRYTPTTCFETFPLPWVLGKEPNASIECVEISCAAHKLDELREHWLHPPEWMKPIEDAIDGFEDFSELPVEASELIRLSAIHERASKDKRLKQRTLTALYN